MRTSLPSVFQVTSPPVKINGAIVLILFGAAIENISQVSAADIGDWRVLKNISPRRYLCSKTETPPIIDGALNDPIWTTAQATEHFVDIQGPGNTHPRHNTWVKMAWDDNFFYVAAQLEEPQVWGTITQRDAVIFQDNDFEVFIDPDGDNHDYYEFEMNTLNTLWDLFLDKPYKDGGKARNEWDLTGIQTAVQIQGSINNPKDHDRGWTLEMAFPWKALSEFAHRPCPPQEGDQWRVNFSRVEWRTKVVDGQYVKLPGKREDNWVWSPIGIVDMHRPEMWGYVQFTSAPQGQGKLLTDVTAYGRAYLYQAYYAQRAYYAKNHRYAQTIEDLGLEKEYNPKHLAWPLTIELQPDGGYRAMAEIRVPGGTERWYIRQDAKLWSE